MSGGGSGGSPPDGCFRRLELRSRYQPEHEPRDRFLLPMLERASAYDRAAGFFSSSSLTVAAHGLDPFAARGGQIRLVVNHSLADRDVEAVERGLALRKAVAADVGKVPLSPADTDDGGSGGLRLLATLVALGQLDIKVAVATDDGGVPLPAEVARPLHHAKFGVFADWCDPPCRVAFEGSNNESEPGWLSNYETYVVSREWWPEFWAELGQEVVDDFERHWQGTPPPKWATFDVPEAKRRHLIANADPDMARDSLVSQGRQDEIDEVVARIVAARGGTQVPDPVADLRELLAAPDGRTGVGLGTATVGPWPHQSDVARKVVSAWPCSRMFADEVGLGKTIEVGLVIRELIVSGRADRVLLLVPASVLEQWQAELWEKFTLAVPRLAGRHLVWPEGSRPNGNLRERIDGERWDAADVMLASSHLARRRSQRPKLVERHWDLVVIDEAHHARRRGGDPGKDDANALLQLLRRMRGSDCWDGLLLATATPMQMHPVEAYDLLELLSLPGPHPDYPTEPSWSEAEAHGFVRYYEQLAEDDPQRRDWPFLVSMARSHFAAHPDPNPHLAAAIEDAESDGPVRRGTARRIRGFHDAIKVRRYRNLEPAELRWLDAWLREHTPMRTLVFRNTRGLLRAYQELGVEGTADVIIPRRRIRDESVVLTGEEQALYDRIETWINDKYAAVQRATAHDNRAKALGFVLTVYRRRLTSSFHAVTQSLAKRRATLAERYDGLVDPSSFLDDDDRRALDDVPDGFEALLETDDADGFVVQMLESTADEIDELDEFIDALHDRDTYDSKLGWLISDLQREMGTPKPDGNARQAIVFTQFTDTMDELRRELAGLWGNEVGCYSGRGGEVYDPAARRWEQVGKEQVKVAFRDGHLRVLVGTDSMSEGLNLQTCDLAYNADLPWNFMRVEQRIGRIDRIGGHPTVHIVNLLIEGTVEEQVYSGIKSDFANFEDIVGAAQPVLTQTEDAIRAVAFESGPNRDELVAEQARQLVAASNEARDAPVNLDTFEAIRDRDVWRPADPLPGERTHEGGDWIDELRETLTTHSVFADRFSPDGDGTWRYDDGRGNQWTVTFDRKIADDTGGRVGLFVWGHPAFPTQPTRTSG